MLSHANNRSLGRAKCRGEDNIKLHFLEIGCGNLDWTQLRVGSIGDHCFKLMKHWTD